MMKAMPKVMLALLLAATPSIIAVPSTAAVARVAGYDAICEAEKHE
jgi:hypothetical protein